MGLCDIKQRQSKIYISIITFRVEQQIQYDTNEYVTTKKLLLINVYSPHSGREEQEKVEFHYYQDIAKRIENNIGSKRTTEQQQILYFHTDE